MLSAYLKSHGHRASILIVKRPGFPYTQGADYLRTARSIEPYDWVGVNWEGSLFRYSRGPDLTERERELVTELVQRLRPDAVGLSVTAPMRRRVAEVTALVRRAHRGPVLWGGAGASIDPEGCAAECDYVCVGEGEPVLLEVAERLDRGAGLDDVAGICCRTATGVRRNPLPPLIQDLDSLPFPDIDPAGKYLVEDGRLTEGFAGFSYSGRYHVMGSRGCPFRCAYCTESYYKELYAGAQFLRRRSPQSIVNELQAARRTAEFTWVQFEDEVFALDADWLEEFSALYRREVGLPFTCYLYPLPNLDRQLALLKEAGMRDTCLSLQSGSPFINRSVFGRAFDADVYVATANKLHAAGIPYYTDVITYNPFETEQDLEETLQVLERAPRATAVFVNKLYVLDHTPLARKLREAADPQKLNTVPTRIFDYYARLFWLAGMEGRELAEACRRLRVFRRWPRLLQSRLSTLLLQRARPILSKLVPGPA